MPANRARTKTFSRALPLGYDLSELGSRGGVESASRAGRRRCRGRRHQPRRRRRQRLDARSDRAPRPTDGDAVVTLVVATAACGVPRQRVADPAAAPRAPRIERVLLRQPPLVVVTVAAADDSV